MCYPAILESSQCLSNITSPLTCTPCELDMWQIFGKWTGHWVFSSSLSKYCLCASPHPWWTQSSLFPSTLVLSWKFKAWDRFLCRSEVRWILWDRRNFVGACFEIPVDSVQQDLRIQGTPWKYGISRQAGGRELSTLLFPEGNKWTLISFSKFYFFCPILCSRKLCPECELLNAALHFSVAKEYILPPFMLKAPIPLNCPWSF